MENVHINSQQEDDLIEAIKNSSNEQSDIAKLYAQLIPLQMFEVNWREINSAIQTRWAGKDALSRVKTMAWKIVSDKNVAHRLFMRHLKNALENGA